MQSHWAPFLKPLWIRNTGTIYASLVQTTRYNQQERNFWVSNLIAYTRLSPCKKNWVVKETDRKRGQPRKGSSAASGPSMLSLHTPWLISRKLPSPDLAPASGYCMLPVLCAQSTEDRSLLQLSPKELYSLGLLALEVPSSMPGVRQDGNHYNSKAI